jgi:1-acyl-sn-glycerol-3-phosphate acyltransferase
MSAPSASAAETTTPHRPKFPPLWRNPSFTLMWTSTAASGFGDRMIMLAALALLAGVAAEADSTSVQAGTQFFFFLPYLFFSVLGGWAADRLPRKWLLMACDESRGLLLLLGVFLIGGASTVDPDKRWQVYAMLFAIGIFAAIFNPTRNAIVPQLVARSQMQPANAVVLVINVVFSMIGMIVGGWIIDPGEASSIETGLWVGAIFYLVSGSFFAFMKPQDHRLFPGDAGPAKASTSLIDGLRYVRNHRRVIGLILIDVMVWGAAATMYSGVIGVVKVHYQLAGDDLIREFTQVSAALGFGMLAGAVVIAVIRTRQEGPLIMGVALAIAGINVLLVSLIPWRPVTYLGAFMVGVSGNVAIVTVISLLQSISPNAVRGSVMGLAGMVTTMVSVTVYGLIWLLPGNADHIIINVLLVLGPVLILTGLIYAMRYLLSGPMIHRGANALRHLVRFFCLVWHRLEWRGRHHIPRHGPVILAANHTTALDPLLMQSACPRQIRWLMLTSYRFRALEWFWRLIDPVFIDMDDSGARVNPARQVRQVVKHLKAGDCLGIFPEGGLQYEHRVLQPLEEGVAAMARLSQAQIVPVWIEGTARSRNMLVHLFQPGHRTISFGRPFTPGPKDDPTAITAELRRRMLELASPESRAEAEGPLPDTKSEPVRDDDGLLKRG